jgi:hypothetical protein
MEHITRKTRPNIKIVVIAVALVTFGTVFLLTGALMTAVYGLKPGDAGYAHYTGQGGIDNTPYQDMLANGCLTKQHFDTDQTYILDTKGLEELGLIWYDPNTCFDAAKNTPGYIIDKVETYGEDQMKITLTKK